MGGEVFAQAVGDGADVDVHIAGRRGFPAVRLPVGVAGAGKKCLGEPLGGAHGELALDDLVGRDELAVLVLDREDRLGVADGEALLGDEVLDVLVQVEQAHRIGDTGAGFADAGGDLVLLEGKLAGEAHVSGGFFHRVEILALEVLDERHFEHVAIRRLTLDDGHGGEPEFFRCAPAAFAGDEFELAVHLADDERLDDAVLADRIDKVIERRLDEGMARLQRAGDDVVDGRFADARRVVLAVGRRGPPGRRVFPDQCAESFAECLLRHGGATITHWAAEFQADFAGKLRGEDFASRQAGLERGGLTVGRGGGIHSACNRASGSASSFPSSPPVRRYARRTPRPPVRHRRMPR